MYIEDGAMTPRRMRMRMRKFTIQIPVDAWCWASCKAETIEEAVRLFKERDFTLQNLETDTIEVTQDEYFYEQIEDSAVWEDDNE
jgi:hypothetical protein